MGLQGSWRDSPLARCVPAPPLTSPSPRLGAAGPLSVPGALPPPGSHRRSELTSFTQHDAPEVAHAAARGDSPSPQ